MAYIATTRTGIHRFPGWSRFVILRMRGKRGSRGGISVRYV